MMTSGDINNAPGPEDATLSDGGFAFGTQSIVYRGGFAFGLSQLIFLAVFG